MAISRIERIIGSVVTAKAERDPGGMFVGHRFGSNVNPVRFSSLDDVSDFLRANPGSGVRMNPGWSKISKNIYLDGTLLR